MRIRIVGLFVLVFVLSVTVAVTYAAIAVIKPFAIDFTNAKDAAAKADWSKPKKLTISASGLGWDGQAAVSRYGWIQTKPLAVGLSWRAPSAISVCVTLRPSPAEFGLNNGQKSTPYGGDVYVRYSADLQHWSSWQVLRHAKPQTPDEKRNPGRHFQGPVGIPRRERREYGRLLSEYSQLDVPWKSDEEAAVRWIVKKDPEFFSKHIPLIGYVEFLFEGEFCGGQRIGSLHASISYGMSGWHTAPKDKALDKGRDSIPWRFKGKEAAEQDAPADAKRPRR